MKANKLKKGWIAGLILSLSCGFLITSVSAGEIMPMKMDELEIFENNENVVDVLVEDAPDVLRDGEDYSYTDMSDEDFLYEESVVVNENFEDQTNFGSDEQLNDCGLENDSVFWILEEGILTISGEGRMMDWESEEEVPWYEVRESIQKIVVGDKITAIGNYAFAGCENAEEVVIPKSVQRIGESACFGCNGIKEITIG